MDKETLFRQYADAFHKINDWIKENFPNALEESKIHSIECDSLHHVYNTSYIVLKDGKVEYHRGSHGWQSNDEIYYPETEVFVNVPKSKNKYAVIQEFIIEWKSQKNYITRTLTPYENIKNFEL